MAHRELEEPAVELSLGNAVERKALVANEGVAIVAAIRKGVADEVEAERAKASVQKVLQDDVLGVLGADGADGELQAGAT